MHANAIPLLYETEGCTNVRVQREYARSLILDEEKERRSGWEKRIRPIVEMYDYCYRYRPNSICNWHEKRRNTFKIVTMSDLKFYVFPS